MSDIGQQIIEATRKAAEANPDFEYKREPHEDGSPYLKGCAYVRKGQPSCIVGHALWNLNLIHASLEDDKHNEDGVDEILDYLHLNLDQDEILWLGEVQGNQDMGTPWMDAVSQADSIGDEYYEDGNYDE